MAKLNFCLSNAYKPIDTFEDGIFTYGKIDVYYPIEIEHINSMYKLFLERPADLYLSRYRMINFTIEQFNALNLVLRLNDQYDILQECVNLGIQPHIDYEYLIERKIIDCGFLEVANMLYILHKNHYDIIKIDLPETHLHPIVIPNYLCFISNYCKKLIIFTYNEYFYDKMG